MRILVTFLAFFIAAQAYAEPEFAVGRLRLVLATGETRMLSVQLAQTPPQLRHGLMFREYLRPYDGMLFDFGWEQPVTMWMKNTMIPLDMIFFNEAGFLVHMVHHTTPYSLEHIASPTPARYVLELEAGKAEQFNIREGDRFELITN